VQHANLVFKLNKSLHIYTKLLFTGEFGIVYKAHLTQWHGQGAPKVVAVKTLKGAVDLKGRIHLITYWLVA